MAERRLFDLYRHFPIVGFTYRIARGIVYTAAGDHDEAAHSMEMNLADLNPFRAHRNAINGIRNLTSSLDQNIWIGERTLGNQPFGLTLVAGSDIYHWCIQIDGVIYELLLQDGRTHIDITSQREHPTKYESLCKRCSWTLIRRQLSCASETSLRDYAKSFEFYKYQAVLPSGHKINCQFFVKMMLAKAINETPSQAAGIILAIMPNLIF